MPKYRMIHVDHYMCKPSLPLDDIYSEVSKKPVYKVPIIRIFGADCAGRKICIHVHGFYPYIAIQNRDPNDAYLGLKIVADIERALRDLTKENTRIRNNEDPDQPPPDPKTNNETDLRESDLLERVQQERKPITRLSADQKSPIHRIELVKSFNYYGYHHEQEDYLKFHLYNPKMVKQLSFLFEGCKVLGRFIPVFWAHLPYVLLFFIDNNLRGMQFIEVEKLYWRKDRAPKPESQTLNSLDQAQTSEQVDNVSLFTTENEPTSTCELEADISFEWIINRQRFGSKGNDDALRELWLDDQEASQASSLIDPKLPIFDLERDYIHQLCESFMVDSQSLNLALTERRTRIKASPRDQARVDSDSSPSLPRDFEDEFDSSLDSLPASSAAIALIDERSAALDDDFSTDDEMPLIVRALETNGNISTCPEQRVNPESGVKDGYHIKDDLSLNADARVKLESKSNKNKFDPLATDDEFSDDDSCLMEAIIKAESQVAKINESDQFESKSELKPVDECQNYSTEAKHNNVNDAESFTSSFDDNIDDLNQTLSKMSADDEANSRDPERSIRGPTAIGSGGSDEVNPNEPSPQLLTKSRSISQFLPCNSFGSTDKGRKDPLRRFSDNSMIDGKSVVCSAGNITKSGSQRSTASSRETISHEYQFLCLMSMELHISTRDNLKPDPHHDPIEALFYCIRNDVPDTSQKPCQVIGMVMTDPFKQPDEPFLSSYAKSPSIKSNMSFAQKIRTLLHKTGLSLKDIELNIVDTELELIMALVEIVRAYDPEILIGYEMEHLSWGYVLERATKLNISISVALSRIVENNLGQNSKVVESTFVQPIMFTGRMVFSTWRIIKHEIKLNTCSYERIHHHALNERVPCFAFETLTQWFNQNRNRWRVIDYYLTRVIGQMRILDKFDLIAKVSELARVYGTQFIDVITRGSQIGIESMMLRLAKLQNLTPLSPTVAQRNKMKAPEALPLVMEPETNIYYDPVAVLDFQSLYPSVVIAYNYCYSTCLGRVSDLEKKERHNFGCSQLHVDEGEVKRLLTSNSVHISPCGVAYVKKDVRHGILPKMLSELIVTRAMVKDQMKKNMKSERPNRRLQRILDHRQHGLKMMANTTYGYAGASYTGRMPCVEIADSIVSKGRETLENAIELVESKAEWGAKVIYGDTDSIFIQFSGCDRNTAFERAYEMVEAITASNPHPIKMKFEKIYQPCVLQTKKRYCGFKFEYPDQVKPEFEAKGIETVRRDCCPAAARMLEMALRIQFTSRDINQVKDYVQHQFVKIMSGKLSNIQDFIFARQYKPRDLDKSESVFVPAWQITKRLLAHDPRAEPRVGERVPFVIIYGEPRTPLVDLAKTPMEVLENLSYRINADYYIQKIICPTLNRVFCTMGIDTLLWYKSMPHQNIVHRSHYLVAQKNQYFSRACKQSTMSQYYSPSHCPVCARSIPVNDDICDTCRVDMQASVVRLTEEIAKSQKKLFSYHQLCKACSSLERTYVEGDEEHRNPCISYDCENLFRYHQAKLDALNSNFLSQILKNLN